MKLLQDDAKAQRKMLKPQIERRRRERMNRSLESLKTLLLPEMETRQRRVEKAEILERTVVFLQNSAKDPSAGGQKLSFQGGFSTCMQRAAEFLGPEGKRLRLGEAVDATFAARFSASAGVHRKTGGSTSPLTLPESSSSMLRLLIQRSKYRLHTPAFAASCSPNTPQQTRAVASAVSKEPQSRPASQSLWRPWPRSQAPELDF
ncbi:uncharacterized protein ACBR49_005159 [Aulostomus maculatus]